MNLVGAIHAALALLCIAVGLIQFLAPKGSAGHRARGYLYVYAMLVVDGTALSLYPATGHFNVLHAGAIANLTCIVIAIVPMLWNPRPRYWKHLHYHWISWSYVGLMSAAAVQLVIRVNPSRTPAQAMTFAATIAVSGIGYIIIRKNRPIPRQKPDPVSAVQHEGASP
jgi:hypothetical protein